MKAETTGPDLYQVRQAEQLRFLCQCPLSICRVVPLFSLPVLHVYLKVSVSDYQYFAQFLGSPPIVACLPIPSG